MHASIFLSQLVLLPLLLFFAEGKKAHGEFARPSLRTNAITFTNPPKWLTESRLDRVAQKMERQLEWSLRRVEVLYYDNQAEFEKVHGWGNAVQAIAKKTENRVLVGPKTNSENFDQVFGHELAHVIMGQKYKQAIPDWLEEGLANFAAKKGVVDYSWLAGQAFQKVETLGHPFQQSNASSADAIRYRYQASTATAELLAAKCGMRDLLQLSVGKKLENYLATFCRIPDLNAALQDWIQKKSGKRSSVTNAKN